jgi:hypothetical protein
MNEYRDSIPRVIYGLAVVAVFAIGGALVAIWRRVA